MELLQIKDLSFRYPDRECDILKNLTFSVSEGEFVVICGESGCGKSTLLKLLKRELTPFGSQSGTVRYCGLPLSQLDDRTAASEIGFVLQNPDSQIVTDYVWHELAFGPENLGLSTDLIRRRVAEMSGYFGIEDWFRKKTSDLSGGQKQLLNLASTMVMHPKLLLLDEPTAQLDPIAAANFISTLQKLNRELGLTILLVEHRLEELFPVADRIILLDHGQIAYDGAPRTIGTYFSQNPNHPMCYGLPAAMRLFHALGFDGESPLTVREGRNWLTAHYTNRISSLPSAAKKTSEEVILELKDVFFRYERDLPDVLRGLSLRIHRGEHFCILGGNGVGKTTALSLLSGLRQPYRGTVLFDGKKQKDYPSHSLYRNFLALLPQNPQSVFLEKTVRDDLGEICRSMNCSAEETQTAITAVAEQLQITQLLTMHPYDLSGGEQQKAALAKMLLLRPKILLLDEPTKGLDACAKEVLASLLRQLKEDGLTVVTVTHDVEFAAANADRCAMFFDGEAVSVDVPTAFFSENNFYTTAANRISRNYYHNVILCDEIIALCRLNERKEVTADA